MYKTYAYFYVIGFDDDPTTISQRLGLKPNETWLKSEDWLPNKPREFNNWQVHSSLEQSEIFLDAHIKSVLDIIEPKRAEILKLRDEGCDIGINCVGYYYDEHPGFHLSAEIIARLAAFSMEVDFDLYCLGKEK
jgi:hypothetical protein